MFIHVHMKTVFRRRNLLQKLWVVWSLVRISKTWSSLKEWYYLIPYYSLYTRLGCSVSDLWNSASEEYFITIIIMELSLVRYNLNWFPPYNKQLRRFSLSFFTWERLDLTTQTAIEIYEIQHMLDLKFRIEKLKTLRSHSLFIHSSNMNMRAIKTSGN